MSNEYEGKPALIRILFVIVFWFAFYVSQFVVGVVTIAQCVFVLITGKPNQYLMQLGDSLAKYVSEILSFVTFNTDKRPFPFAEFPKSDLVVAEN